VRRGRLYPDVARAEYALRRIRRARANVRLLSRVCLFALLLELVLFALTSPRLAVRAVKVQCPDPALYAWTQKVLSDTRGKNIVRIRVRRLAHRLSGHPRIREAKVWRDLPHAIVAEVTPRKPYASVRIPGAVFIVDADLVAFQRRPAPLPGCPVLAIPGRRLPDLGQKWRDPYLTSVARALEAARDRGFKVSRVTIDQGGDMCLNILNGIEIRAGSPQDIEKKLWVASKFLMSRVVPLQTIQYVDVSCPSAPAFRPKPTGNAAAPR